jgi:hypothetical protein
VEGRGNEDRGKKEGRSGKKVEKNEGRRRLPSML